MATFQADATVDIVVPANPQWTFLAPTDFTTPRLIAVGVESLQPINADWNQAGYVSWYPTDSGVIAPHGYSSIPLNQFSGKGWWGVVVPDITPLPWGIAFLPNYWLSQLRITLYLYK